MAAVVASSAYQVPDVVGISFFLLFFIVSNDGILQLLVGEINTLLSGVFSRRKAGRIAAGSVFEFLGFPVKAVFPGDEKVCVCPCRGCVWIHTQGYQFCDCKAQRREYWNDFKYVLEELQTLFSSSCCASAALYASSRQRYSFVELYRRRLDSAVDKAVSSLAHCLKVFSDEDSAGNDTYTPILRKVRDFNIPTPDYGFLSGFRALRYGVIWSGGSKWYSKLLFKLEPLYQDACATMEAAIARHNAEAEQEAAAKAQRLHAKRLKK